MNLGTARIGCLDSFLHDDKKEKYLEKIGLEIFVL